MNRIFFRNELEGVVTFWRIFRRDGVTLGFSGHDRDLYFGGILHRAAPGMVPSAIRKNGDLSPDSAEVQGVLSHTSIRSDELVAGRFDRAKITMGAVDWETLEHETFYNGSFGTITQKASSFTADLVSSKAQLGTDFIPRTSPTCRAQFCGPGCTLALPRFSTDASVTSIDVTANAVEFGGLNQQLYVHGELRWLGGPHAGLKEQIVDITATGIVLNTPLSSALALGTRARLVEGCDHLLSTCSTRFDNAVNFQGEPFVPGNDLLARRPL